MAVAQDAHLEGDLGEVPVGELLRWMSSSRTTGMLCLYGATERYELHFEQGELQEGSRLMPGPQRIELGRVRNAAELLRLLRESLLWTEGRFVLHAPAGAPAEAAARPEPSVQTLQLLLAESLAAGRHGLPGLSEAAMRIASMSRDPRTSLKQLSEVVASDPALTQAVLRYANTASDRPGRPIDSLPMAVSRVGYRTILPLALAVCLYSRPMHSAQLDRLQRQLWRHSLSVALLCRALAVKVKLNDEEAFLCGLLHDMGKAVLLDLVDDLVLSGRVPAAITPEALELLLQEQHTRIGPPTASWRLPASVHHVVALHHRPEQAIESRSMVAAVALANTAILLLETHGTLPEAEELLRLPAARILGLKQHQAESLAAAAAECHERGQSFIGG
jgi:HD-like signal output (HDOD) protein